MNYQLINFDGIKKISVWDPWKMKMLEDVLKVIEHLVP